MAWIPPSFPFPLSSSLSVHNQLSHLSLLPALLHGVLPDQLPDLVPDILPDLLSTVYPDLLSTNYFSRGAALVLVDTLLSLEVFFSHALLNSDLMVFTIEEPDFINVLGTEATPGRVLVLSVLSFLGPVEGSNFSTVLISLPDLQFPDPDEHVVVDNVVSSVNLSSGLDSFCISDWILCSISCEAAEVT